MFCNFLFNYIKTNLKKVSIYLLTVTGLFAEKCQLTDRVVMVRPEYFQYNLQTAKTNAFQTNIKADNVRAKAIKEFEEAVRKLSSKGITVIEMPSCSVITPDSVFPNNWFSTHLMVSDRRLLVMYPMLTPNRRAERNVRVLRKKLQENGVKLSEFFDLSGFEEKGEILEGTGSLVLDRVHGVAFASLSPRTNEEVLCEFCSKLGYKPVTFRSYDKVGKLIYHTNVMMSVGEGFCVICLEAIRDEDERRQVIEKLNYLDLEIVDISKEQVSMMCGNVLELKNKDEQRYIVMSERALDGFREDQLERLREYGELVPIKIDTIESVGGGSARCMLAEIF